MNDPLAEDEARGFLSWAVGILQSLDAHIDLGMEWKAGDLDIEDTASINEVLSHARSLLGQLKEMGYVTHRGAALMPPVREYPS